MREKEKQIDELKKEHQKKLLNEKKKSEQGMSYFFYQLNKLSFEVLEAANKIKEDYNKRNAIVI
jgi:hypothetical protein